MSAGSSEASAAVNRELGLLAPAFRNAVEQALAECKARGLDAWVYESFRPQALQSLYYARGRTVQPPDKPVTNAASNLYSWHGYGLAVDVISRADGWNKPEAWFREVADCFRKYGCRWGGEWEMQDLPHFQWGKCRPSPSGLARELMRTQGLQAVWTAVGAGAAQWASFVPERTGDTAVDALQLAEPARTAALILHARFPSLEFTSGRRDKRGQAEAMAGNVVQNRRWIEQTYQHSAVRAKCQQWIDSHPVAQTQPVITDGLCSVLNACSDDELAALSKHLSGQAFDVRPVLTPDGEVIKQFIRALPKLERFLEQEGGLVRWHAQF
ncbi:MAG: M15 family metallopeptidase [Nevskia sp.]|nr:M15 family metallopeptidase [Nevskia sp.]